MNRKITTFFCLAILILVACGTTEEIADVKYASEVVSTASVPLTYISSEDVVNTVQVEEELDKITNLDHTKEIQENVFQMAIKEPLANGTEASINFFTWQVIDGEKKVIDETYYNDLEQDFSYKVGEFYYELWHEYPNFYLSYQDLKLDTSFLDAASIGQMITVPVTLGASQQQLTDLMGEPVITDWYHGGSYYTYNNIAFILDDNMNVVAINLPGNRIKKSLNQVTEILGIPSLKTVDELDGTIFYSYNVGDYQLSFEAINKEVFVRNVWLNEY